METLEKEMTLQTPELTAGKEPKTVVKASLVLIQKGIKDQVFSVSTLSINLESNLESCVKRLPLGCEQVYCSCSF